MNCPECGELVSPVMRGKTVKCPACDATLLGGAQVVVVQQTETCVPCNEEHPKGEPCPTCGRTLLLG